MDDQAAGRRLDFLDGLRGLAISLVMLLHYWEITWFDFSIKLPQGLVIDLNFLATSGSLGVTLFFFISGFCLFLSYDRNQNIRHYANRRIFKILPSYLLSIFIIFVFFEFPYSSIKDFSFHFLTHLLFIHNWFPETYGSINGVYWSLAVEVQFYLIFPFLFQWIKKYPVTSIVTGLVVAQIFRTLIYIWNPERYDPWINQLPAYLDVFATGIAAAVLYSRWQTQPPRIFRSKISATSIAVIGLGLFLICLYCVHSNRYVPGIPKTQTWIRGPLTLTMLIMSLGSAFAFSQWNYILANPLMKLLSVVSYNLYLWHQYIGHKLMIGKIPYYAGDPHHDFSWQKRFLLLAVCFSVILAWLLTKFFEKPVLDRTRFPWRTRHHKTP